MFRIVHLRIIAVATTVILLQSSASASGSQPASNPPDANTSGVVTGQYVVKTGATGTLVGATPIGNGWAVVSSDEAGSADDVAQSLSKQLSAVVEPDVAYQLTADPLFPEQWPLHNDGQTGGTPGADLGMREAWKISSGSADVVVAVIDSGIDLTHPDLIGQVWVNEAEIPDNGIDDDHNGYVDDLYGWDYFENDGYPQDTIWHGTHVAGIVAAARNEVGTVGVAPGVKVMPLRACHFWCSGSVVAQAVDYAVDNGASVINLSLGGYRSSTPLIEAVAAASAAGVVVVAAAGNDSNDNDLNPFFPAALPGVISVAASDDNDTLGLFSNFGRKSVDLAAPGSLILAPVPVSKRPSGYFTGTGTSMAAPHVSGVVALMLSVDPCLSAPEVVSRLIETTDALDGPPTKSDGRLAADAALDTVSPTRDGGFAITDSETHGLTDVPLNFVASTTCDQAGVTWDFGDGSSKTGTEVTHVYRRAGTFTVSASSRLGEDSATVKIGEAFADTAGHVFEEAVFWLSMSGITKGCGPDSFCPDQPITRGQMAAFLARALNLPTAPTDQFTDDNTSIFQNDINRLAASGITKGCSSGSFCPEAPVTRGQMAAFLARALNLPTTPTDHFTDDNTSIFQNDINRLAASGITKGCASDSFCPDQSITRGQMAAFLHRALGR